MKLTKISTLSIKLLKVPGGAHSIGGPPVASPHDISHVGGCLPPGEVVDGTVDLWLL
jgi:hypothetical protein